MKELGKLALWVTVALAIAAGVVKAFFVDIYVVGHNAMAPTMLVGEKVLAWRGEAPAFGRIAVCEHPQLPGQFVMGRVIGTEGSVISTDRGVLHIANETPDLDIVGTERFYDADHDREDEVRYGRESIGGAEHELMIRVGYALELRETRVAPGKLYLLSDYRSFGGQDSRTFGQVDATTCRGNIFMRLSPDARHEGGPFTHGWFERLR